MRTLEQYFFLDRNGTGTLASGTASVSFVINYKKSKSLENVDEYKAPPNGECTLAMLLTSASSTASVTVSARNLYGDLAEKDFWDVETITATTSGVNCINMLHITNSEKYDPNATGIEIKIARSESVDVTYKGRIIRA